ncbi:kinase-like domain, phloem protein 2-like protein [Tanacetum coccineum]
MVYQLTKFHVQRVDMVINPPWNLPFLGAKGLTSPEQTAIGKGISNPFMALTMDIHLSCCKDQKRRLEVLQIKTNSKNSIYNILRKLKVFKVKIKNVLKELEVHNSEPSDRYWFGSCPKQKDLECSDERRNREKLREREDVGGMIRKDIPRENLEPRTDGTLCLKGRNFSSNSGSTSEGLGTILDIDTTCLSSRDRTRQAERNYSNSREYATCLLLDFGNGWLSIYHIVIFQYNIVIQASIKAAPFEALDTEKVIQIKQRIQAARDRQKSYANLKRKPMEFQVRDKVMLRVSPWKGVVRFGKRGKVHNTFHVSNLKKFYSDEPLAVPLEGLHIDDKLQFVEEPVEIIEREVKRLKNDREQLFWMEISMLSTLKHLVSLVGFCDDNDEKVIIYKNETRGALVNYLSDPMLLTWVRRLEICVGLAHALSYIHYDEPRDFSVIHRRISSSTVLLNDGWEPKLCEFEDSMKIKASQRHHSFHTNRVKGVNGYADPTYLETKRVSHKSDMYSFGIVLFELVCGRTSIINSDTNKYLAPLAVTHYREKRLDEIIDWDLWKQMNSQSFNIFAETAYDCLNEEQSQRPNIDEIVSRLEKALDYQNVVRVFFLFHLSIIIARGVIGFIGSG